MPSKKSQTLSCTGLHPAGHGSTLTPMAEDIQQIYSEVEAADYLALSPHTLRNWRSEGKGPDYIQLEGRTIRYTLSALNEWLARQPRGGRVA